MNEWPGQGGWQPAGQQPGQPANPPFTYQDPPPAGWPAGFQQQGQFQPQGQLQPLPPGVPGMIGNEPVLVVIGDISVTPTTVYTPTGSRPLSEVGWTFTDLSSTSQAIPTWAIVCAVVFFLACFLGLLFLLAKENSTTGAVQVTVHGPGFVHTTTMPVSSIEQVADINARVSYVRSLVATGYPQGWQQPGQPGPGWQQPGR
jgi:hypothetical protein